MPKVSEFLIERMVNSGVKHVFGVTGDYVSNLFRDFIGSGINFINTSDQVGAAHAADVYARIRGVGCVCVGYNVGALKIINAVACAYAEKSPMIVISGAPGPSDSKHRNNQKDIFDKITCASVVLDDPNTAGYKIDYAFEYLHHLKQPIYIEIPRDISDKMISYDVYRQGTPQFPKTDNDFLEESVEEVIKLISSAKNPLILADIELARLGFGSLLMKFATKTNIPIATTLMSKSVISEVSPLYLGVYGQESVQKTIDETDCLITLGTMLNQTSFNLLFPKFKRKNVISASLSGLFIGHHEYKNVNFVDFCNTLFTSNISKKTQRFESVINKNKVKFVPSDDVITTSRFFEKINSIIDETTSVLSDVGDCLFGSTDIVMSDRNTFISSALYCTMGMSIPGALGAQLANPETRPIVLVGDGAFQMSCAELGTIHANGLNPIIFILNNNGYATEKVLSCDKFNNIPSWNYEKIVEMVGGVGIKVNTEKELEKVVVSALQNKKSLYIINVVVNEISSALKAASKDLRDLNKYE